MALSSLNPPEPGKDDPLMPFEQGQLERLLNSIATAPDRVRGALTANLLTKVLPDAAVVARAPRYVGEDRWEVRVIYSTEGEAKQMRDVLMKGQG